MADRPVAVTLMASACVLLVAAVFGCGPRPAVESGGSLASEGGRWIAFTRATSFVAPNFESEIYAVNVDGTGEERLTDSPGLDAFPAWRFREDVHRARRRPSYTQLFRRGVSSACTHLPGQRPSHKPQHTNRKG